jgi:hypothetical protein
MIEIRFDKTKDKVALLIWFLVDHSVELIIKIFLQFSIFLLTYLFICYCQLHN